MTTIELYKLAGSFAENKDVARDIRLKKIKPLLDEGKKVTLDFKSVDSATQSFIHALLSELIREYGSGVLDKLAFKNCSITVQKIITIVVDYTQEGL